MLVRRKLKDAVLAFQMTSDIWGRTSLQAAGLVCKITALARDATPTNQNLAQFLHRLTEQELAARAMDAVVARIKEAAFTVEKDYDTYDVSIMPHLPKPKLMDLARCEWIHEK
jgi:DNA replication protein DnaC